MTRLTLMLSSVLDPCLSQSALVCMVLGVLLGSTVICDGCPGPWILVRKVRCAQVITWLLRTWALGPGAKMSGLHEVCKV